MYEDNRFLVIHPKTKEAACYYGKNTQWCTAATKGDNYFDEYNNQGPLYIVIDKQNNRKYQFHYESGQFMDETDSLIDFGKHEDLLLMVSKLFPHDKIEADGCGIINLNEKYGLIDEDGNWIVKPKFDHIDVTEENGERIVMLNKKCGLIKITDNKLNWLVKPEFDLIFYMEDDGKRKVELNGKYGLIKIVNNKLILVAKPEFNRISSWDDNGYRIVILNGKYGLIDKNGDWLLKSEFDWIDNLESDGNRVAELNGETGIIDKNGKWIPEQ